MWEKGRWKGVARIRRKRKESGGGGVNRGGRIDSEMTRRKCRGVPH